MLLEIIHCSCSCEIFSKEGYFFSFVFFCIRIRICIVQLKDDMTAFFDGLIDFIKHFLFLFIHLASVDVIRYAIPTQQVLLARGPKKVKQLILIHHPDAIIGVVACKLRFFSHFKEFRISSAFYKINITNSTFDGRNSLVSLNISTSINYTIKKIRREFSRTENTSKCDKLLIITCLIVMVNRMLSKQPIYYLFSMGIDFCCVPSNHWIIYDGRPVHRNNW